MFSPCSPRRFSPSILGVDGFRGWWPRPFGAGVWGMAITLALVALVHLASCSRENPAYCDEEVECPDGEACNHERNECVPDGLDAADCEPGLCPEEAPICDLDTGACRSCEYGGAGDEECSAQDEGAPACTPEGMCVECEEARHCPAESPVCEERQCGPCEESEEGDQICASRDDELAYCAEGACAECREDAHCGGDAPICDDGACRPCERGGECESGVCDTFGGSCAAPEDVVHVAQPEDGGEDGPGCGSEEAPCASISGEEGALDQIGAERGFVFVRGAQPVYFENVEIGGGDLEELTVVAEEGVRLEPDRDDPVFELDSEDAALRVEGADLLIETQGEEERALRCDDGALELDGMVGGAEPGISIQGFNDEAVRGSSCALTLAGVEVRDSGGSQVRGSGASAVEIEASEIRGGEGLGIETSSDTELALDGVAVTGHGDHGIDAGGREVAIRDSAIGENGGAGLVASVERVEIAETEIFENEGAGIEVDGGSLDLRRSVVRENFLGGVSLEDTAFEIENNLIYRNGLGVLEDPEFGGIFARATPEPDGAASRLAYNTIAQNESVAAADAHGVDCGEAGEVRATSNLVHLGEGGDPAVNDACTWEWVYSNVESGDSLDFGDAPANTSQDPALRDPDEGDYRLTGDSPCVGRGDPDAEVEIDHRGEERPVGDAPDCGAFELQDDES